jgi:hypothetical protein
VREALLDLGGRASTPAGRQFPVVQPRFFSSLRTAALRPSWLSRFAGEGQSARQFHCRRRNPLLTTGCRVWSTPTVGTGRSMMRDESRKNAAAEFVAAMDEFLVQEAAAGHTLEESLAKPTSCLGSHITVWSPRGALYSRSCPSREGGPAVSIICRSCRDSRRRRGPRSFLLRNFTNAPVQSPSRGDPVMTRPEGSIQCGGLSVPRWHCFYLLRRHQHLRPMTNSSAEGHRDPREIL